MAYDQKIIEQVESLNDIVEIISSYIPLKRAGRSFKACCPFHQEKTPSFIVNAERQTFHCFGCGEGGDVLTFVMKYEQLSFPEALKMLAERVHVELPETKVRSEEKSYADILYQICEEAYQFYHHLFMKTDLAGKARSYWKERGLGEKEAAEFGIGYATEEWRKLFEHLVQKGFKPDFILRSGLAAKSSQGNPYDWFRSRLIFPIRNAQGRVIAFGGRVLTKDIPKYLNSPETEIFKKRKEFYGLSKAKTAFIGQQNTVRQMIVVEGYMDCIQLQAGGFVNTVATLGTAFGEDHVRILKRYVDEAIVLYDGDRAGEQAALRGLDIFLEEGMSARAVALPQGFDPDDFLRQKGKEALQEEINRAQDVFDFKLKILLNRYNQSDSIGMLKITGEFLDTFLKIKSQVLLDRYIKKLAQTLGVEERSIRIELEKLKTKTTSAKPLLQSKPALPQKPVPEPVYEKMILSLMLEYPPFFHEFNRVLSDYEFEGVRSRELFRLIQVQLQENIEKFTPSTFLSQIENPSLKTFASELLVSEFSDDTRDKSFYNCLKRMKQVVVSKQLKELQGRLRKAEASGDHSLVTSLVQSYQELLEASKQFEETP